MSIFRHFHFSARGRTFYDQIHDLKSTTRKFLLQRVQRRQTIEEPWQQPPPMASKAANSNGTKRMKRNKMPQTPMVLPGPLLLAPKKVRVKNRNREFICVIFFLLSDLKPPETLNLSFIVPFTKIMLC